MNWNSSSNRAGYVIHEWISYLVFGISALLLVAEVTYEKHGYFDIEEWFGFYCGHGFMAVIVTVACAWLLRPLIRRKEADRDMAG